MDEKVKENQGLIASRQAGVGIDDLPMLSKRKCRDGITKNIIFLTKEMHSLTLLIPCSLIPSMVGNGVKPIADYEPSMHPNSQNGVFDSIIVGVALKQKEKNP